MNINKKYYKKKGYITPYALLILSYVILVCTNLLMIIQDQKDFFNANQNIIKADYESLGDLEEININFLLGIEEAIEMSRNEKDFANCFRNLNIIPKNIVNKKYYNSLGFQQTFIYIGGGTEKNNFVNEGQYLRTLINVKWMKGNFKRNYLVYIKIKNPYFENQQVNKNLIDEKTLYSIEQIILK